MTEEVLEKFYKVNSFIVQISWLLTTAGVFFICFIEAGLIKQGGPRPDCLDPVIWATAINTVITTLSNVFDHYLCEKL